MQYAVATAILTLFVILLWFFSGKFVINILLTVLIAREIYRLNNPPLFKVHIV